jgi:zinc D-Ala-D-Ala dipeptidase
MALLSQNAIILRLEQGVQLGELGALRKMIPIQENNEPLVDVRYKGFSLEQPHPYESVGAPYGGYSPFCVREGVLERLLRVQRHLNEILPGYTLHLFDAYRPVSVQAYMVQYTRQQILKERQLDSATLSVEQEQEVMQLVYQVWARASEDPLQPPPHSTGACVDLTIVDASGQKLEMGSDFDELSDRILPNYYREDKSEYGRLVHRNRECLNTLMESAGFVRLTHEWWHFSYGDQMWALLKHLVSLEPQKVAFYGRIG